MKSLSDGNCKCQKQVVHKSLKLGHYQKKKSAKYPKRVYLGILVGWKPNQRKMFFLQRVPLFGSLQEHLQRKMTMDGR